MNVCRRHMTRTNGQGGDRFGDDARLPVFQRNVVLKSVDFRKRRTTAVHRAGAPRIATRTTDGSTRPGTGSLIHLSIHTCRASVVYMSPLDDPSAKSMLTVAPSHP